MFILYTFRYLNLILTFKRKPYERLFRSQDASNLLDLTERSRVWVKNLPIIVEDLNNFIIRLLGISPAEAIEIERVIAMPSKTHNGPMGFDKKNFLVIY